MRHDHQDRNRDQTIMPIGFNESVFGDVFGINVMIAKRFNKRCANNGGILAAKGVAKKVDKSRDKVGENVA